MVSPDLGMGQAIYDRLMPLLVAFAGGGSGPWRIECIERVPGEPLPPAPRLSVLEGPAVQAGHDAAALPADRGLRDPADRRAPAGHRHGAGASTATKGGSG